MDWSRHGKKRSRFGKWIDERGISQQEIMSKSGVSKDVLTRVSNKDDAPSWRTRKRLMEAVRDYDEDARRDDFWDD